MDLTIKWIHYPFVFDKIKQMVVSVKDRNEKYINSWFSFLLKDPKWPDFNSKSSEKPPVKYNMLNDQLDWISGLEKAIKYIRTMVLMKHKISHVWSDSQNQKCVKMCF